MIGVIDYGVGNVQAFLNLYRRSGVEACRVRVGVDLDRVSHVILPGVGHFDGAMSALRKSGLTNDLEQAVLVENKPLLGVCVGLQMLAESSDEGESLGLGWIPGRVVALSSKIPSVSLPMPHMGWNDVSVVKDCDFARAAFDDTSKFYFLHSFCLEAEDRSSVIAVTRYGIDFDVVVATGNIYGMQCHPEKSHGWGEKFLMAFAGVRHVAP